MASSPNLFGFDIRKPGVVAGGAQYYSAKSAPFRPMPPAGGPWITFDKYVNPSVFVPQERVGTEQSPAGDRVVVPAGVNAGFDLFFLWDDAMDMIANYPRDEAARDTAYAYSWMDLTAFGIPAPADETFEVLIGREIRPPTLTDDRGLIGYDIVSSYFISALAGYDHANSSPVFINTVRSVINSVGLISASVSPSTLADIVAASDNEIGEDKFFAIGLYLLWDHSGQVTNALGIA